MLELQPNLAPGDAFLHNDPYRGNTHAADHSILIPIFVEGGHLSTAVPKVHQADCGNALPTTNSATAKDVHEEGARIFLCSFLLYVISVFAVVQRSVVRV